MPGRTLYTEIPALGAVGLTVLPDDGRVYLSVASALWCSPKLVLTPEEVELLAGELVAAARIARAQAATGPRAQEPIPMAKGAL